MVHDYRARYLELGETDETFVRCQFCFRDHSADYEEPIESEIEIVESEWVREPDWMD